MALITFDNIELPTEVGYSFVGGPTFNNTIIVTSGGYEHVNHNWSASRRTYNCVKELTLAQYRLLLAFFEARRGNGRAFRFKDPNDYSVTDEVLVVTGGPTIQLTKKYADSVNPIYRDIVKIRASPTVTMKRGGSAFTAFSLDSATGIITLTADSTKTITGITKAAAAVVTCTGHGFTTGDTIYFTGISGMTEMNGQVGVITVIDANSFSVAINSTSYTTYTSGGSAVKYVQPSETLSWTGDFDVPVRFVAAEFNPERVAANAFTISGLQMIEVRI